jgi:hypothetical protein
LEKKTFVFIEAKQERQRPVWITELKRASQETLMNTLSIEEVGRSSSSNSYTMPKYSECKACTHNLTLEEPRFSQRLQWQCANNPFL